MNGSLFISPLSQADLANTLMVEIENLLVSLKLIVDPMQTNNHKRVFKAGELFAHHIIYAGCSPHLRFEPESPDDTNYCHVALHGIFDEPQLITGTNTNKPRCPECRARLQNWKPLLSNTNHYCLTCGAKIPREKWDWRQQAAVGRFFIEIRNVFPSEATPSDGFMAALKNATEYEWQYAWAGRFRAY